MSIHSNENLAKCIFENDLTGVEEQLASGVRINGLTHYDFTEQTRLYDTMVTIAVKHADLEILKKILKCGFDVNESDDSDLTPLMLAVNRNNVEGVLILLEAAADVNIQDSSGFTALMRATKEGNIRMCELLLNAGADPSITSIVKWSRDVKESALQIAERLGHTDIVRLLQNHNRS